MDRWREGKEAEKVESMMMSPSNRGGTRGVLQMLALMKAMREREREREEQMLNDDV